MAESGSKPAQPERTGRQRQSNLLRRQLPLQSETSYFILANVLDIVLTNMLLRNDAMEANPIAFYFLARWGFSGMIAFKLVIVAAVCLLAQYIASRSLPKARLLLIAGTIIVGAVVIYSMRLYWLHFR